MEKVVSVCGPVIKILATFCQVAGQLEVTCSARLCYDTPKHYCVHTSYSII